MKTITKLDFDSLTQEERLVAVCQDVLAQLRMRGKKSFTPSKGSYFEMPVRPIPEDLQDIVDEVQPNCKACAIGSMWLSRARLFDAVPGSCLQEFKHEVIAHRESMVEHLEGIADPDQLELIEAAFELWRDVFRDPGLKNGACVFGSRYPNHKDRLRAIMKNIIRNKGRFVVKPATCDEATEAREACYAKMKEGE